MSPTPFRPPLAENALPPAGRLKATLAVLLACGLLAAPPAGAQAQSSTGAATLRQAFDTAWQRQPEARAAQARADAVRARAEQADSWLADAPAVEISGRSDRYNRDAGTREYEVGLALPLWRPGERGRAQALAAAEADSLAGMLTQSRLQLAASVREAWWALQRARLDRELADARIAHAETLAADVARRVQAGELARADGHQAGSALAAARSEQAAAVLAQAEAAQLLQALTGLPPAGSQEARAEALPPASTAETLADEDGAKPQADAAHPLLNALSTEAERARRQQALAASQGSGPPELTLATTHERDAYGERYADSLTLALRIPFGAGGASRARVAEASAERIAAETRLEAERQRLRADIALARARVDAQARQLDAAAERDRLAAETRGFYDKAFRLGETDLPTRLRIELDAVEAERAHARARIDAAEAVSRLRQALGLLPE